MSILNRRSPFNHLRNEPNAFLVTIPDLPIGSSFSLHHCHGLAIAMALPSPRLASLMRDLDLDFRFDFRVEKKRKSRHSNPQPLASYELIDE